MQYERRSNKDGTHYYSFVWYDTKSKKRIRMSRKDIFKRFGKDILTEDEAKECIKLLAAQYHTETFRIQARLSWEKDYYNFSALLDQYVTVQKKTAPNSWKNNEFYIKHYVLPFFLTEKKLNNIEQWADYFDEYKEWLEKAKQIRSDATISYGGKNHAIKGLNTFLL